MPGWSLLLPWIAFEIWWIWRARGNARTAERERWTQRAGYLTLLVAAAVLAWGRPRLGPLEPWLGLSLWPTPPAVELAGLVVTGAGLAFAIWAREHLGRYWSGTITLKEGHQLIRTGPYTIVRHPIYTGILVGLVGVLVAAGQLRALFALSLVLLALLRKIAIEERLLSRHFGDEYTRFRREVKALIPFLL